MIIFMKGFIAFLGMFFFAILAYLSYIGIEEFLFDQTSMAKTSSNETNESSSMFFIDNIIMQVDQATTSSHKTNIDKIQEALDDSETEIKTVENLTANPYRGHMQKNDISLNINHETISISKINNATRNNDVSTGKNSTHSNPNINIVYSTGDNTKKTHIPSKTPKPNITKSTKAELPQLNKANTYKIEIKNITINPMIVPKQQQNEFKFDPTFFRFYYYDFKMKNLFKTPKLYAHLVNYESPNKTLYNYFNRYMRYNDFFVFKDNNIQHRISLIKFEMNYNTSIFYNEHAVLVINEHGEVSYIDYGIQLEEKRILEFHNLFHTVYPDWCIADLEFLNECKKGEKSVEDYQAVIVLLIQKTQEYILEQKELKHIELDV